MKKIKKWLRSPASAIAALVVAIALLLFSGIGGARAALTILSETYTSRVAMEDIGISLIENEKIVGSRDYRNGAWVKTTGSVLTEVPESPVLGAEYKEELSVRNTGTINTYVRVTITKYWLDAKGKKSTGLSPDLIELNLTNLDSDWLEDTAAATTERTVLYYNKLLESGDETAIFADKVAINNSIADKVSQQTKGSKIITTYDYDGVQFCVEVTADAVQEHNAEDAIKSAWGRSVSVSGSSLSLK